MALFAVAAMPLSSLATARPAVGTVPIGSARDGDERRCTIVPTNRPFAVVVTARPDGDEL
jgi:hypothetical protein